MGKFPAQIERVLHGDIHALTGLGTVRMAGVTGNEDMRSEVFGVFFPDVIEFIGNAMSNFIDRPPGNFLHVQRMRMKNPFRSRDQIISRNVAVRHPFVFAEFIKLDIHSEQIAAFARYDHRAAAIG